MKEETKRKILFIVICILTISILFTAIKLNENRRYSKLSTSKISNYLTEIKYDDVSSYVVEQPNAIIYVSDSSDDKTRKFDNIIIPVIKKYNLDDVITFININDQSIDNPFYQNSPELIFYENGNIKDVIDVSTLNTKDDVINILKERSVIGD